MGRVWSFRCFGKKGIMHKIDTLFSLYMVGNYESKKRSTIRHIAPVPYQGTKPDIHPPAHLLHTHCRADGVTQCGVFNWTHLGAFTGVPIESCR